jgi:small GTP-binding protein
MRLDTARTDQAKIGEGRPRETEWLCNVYAAQTGARLNRWRAVAKRLRHARHMPPLLLTGEQEELLAKARQALSDLQVVLASIAADEETRVLLGRASRQLDELFLLVVVGEFNSGKSAFINALVGRPVLPEGVTPTTSQINVLRYGDDESAATTGDGVRHVTAPAELLRHIHLVDTPGTNAVVREHEKLTTDYVPRADLVFFVTSADRPFTESERQFLSGIREWGKKIVFVVNKVDILDGAQQVSDVATFVATHAERLIGGKPEVFPVSARAALRAKRGEMAAWAASGFEPLERYVDDTLDDAGRLRLKLLNPIGVGLRLTDGYLARARGRLDLLAGDFEMLDGVAAELGQYEADMRRGVALRLAEIDRELLEMEQRGHRFFDEMLRVGRVVDLLNRTRVQQEFERQVVGDTPQSVERRVNDLVDWMVDADLREWQAVTARLAERRRQYRDRLVGEAEAGGFHADRARLMGSVSADVQRVVNTYDKSAESRALADGARTAVAAAAATGAGALGLGTVVTVAATTAAADVTGLVMAGLVGALAFFIIPARRRRARREMREKITEMRERMSASISNEFEREIGRSAQRIRDSFAPYERFVRAEREKLEQAHTSLEAQHRVLQDLRARVEQWVPAT